LLEVLQDYVARCDIYCDPDANIHSVRDAILTASPTRLPKLANTYREMLYDWVNLSRPSIDTLWTKVGVNTTQWQGAVQVHRCECRLRKNKKAGTNVARKEGVSTNPK